LRKQIEQARPIPLHRSGFAQCGVHVEPEAGHGGGMDAEGGSGLGFVRVHVSDVLGRLAARGVFLGTSSWKYPGWMGPLYTASRYQFRGKHSEARFERTCLAEYASVFRSVCVDAAYYAFPTAPWLAGLMADVPEGFRFSFKVTDEITIRRFPRLARFGPRKGTDNINFLNASLFQDAFLARLEPHRAKVGMLVFEFSHFHPGDYARGRDFVADLDGFLGSLPGGWDYGVEVRNRTFLQPAYFDMLARHRVAHVYTSWEAMPSIEEQWLAPGSRTNPDVMGARLLLRPGRRYEEAVDAFAPYDAVRDPNPSARNVAVEMILSCLKATRPGRAYLYVNNRFEGSALGTIAAILRLLEQATVHVHPPL
jgi:uncharacterized protein YecE (DUF72 family)